MKLGWLLYDEDGDFTFHKTKDSWKEGRWVQIGYFEIEE
jgi:hypothetical protein